MGAVMAELSKTAKASMVKEVKKTEVETLEQKIRKIRLGLSAVPTEYIPAHRVKALLDAYDAMRLKLVAVSWVEALESGKSYRVTLVHDEVTVQEIEHERCYSNPAAV
jgi:hypothetical protein